MNTIRRATPNRAMLATLAGLSIALASSAQGAMQPGQPTLPVFEEPRVDTSSKQFDLSFPGGTVSEYFDAIRSIPGVVANISLSPGGQDMPMPPIRLTNVSVSVAVRAVETLTDETGAPLFSTRLIEANDSSTLYAVTSRPPRSAGRGSRSDSSESLELWSFPVATLLEPSGGASMSADSLLGAIDLLLGAGSPDATPPRVMLHKETSTLIMRANKDQMVAVEHMLGGLERDMNNRRALAKPAFLELSETRSMLSNLEGRQKLHNAKIAMLERRRRQLQDLIATGAANSAEMMDIDDRATVLEEEKLELDMQLEQTRQRLMIIEQTAEQRISRTFRVARDRGEPTLDASRAISRAMSPVPDVALTPDGSLSVTGTESQLSAIESWLRIQNLLSK